MSLIKCENCKKEFKSTEIESHRLYCIFSIDRKEIENMIPCEICNEFIEFDKYEEHIQTCGIIPNFSFLQENTFEEITQNANVLLSNIIQIDNFINVINNINNVNENNSVNENNVNDIMINIDNYDNLIQLDNNNVNMGVKNINNFIKRKHENITCPICTTECEEIGVTSCNHKFCYECIGEWLRCNKKCPICMIEFLDK